MKASEQDTKSWLFPVELAANYGFNVRELNEIEHLVEENQDDLMEAWNEYFG